MKIKDQFNEKIFELRQQGMSYPKIRQALLEQYGETLDLRTISLKCKKMFKEKNIDMQTCKRGRKVEWKQGEHEEIINNEIFKLKEQGYSYTSIVKTLATKGIIINADKVGRLCRKIYADKGESIPKAAEVRPMNRDELYNLAERGLSNNDIWEMLKEQGIEISFSKLSTVIKSVYEEKGKKRVGGRQSIKNIDDEEIYSLKMQGKSIRDISKYYQSKGIKIGETAIYKKAKKLFEEKDKEMPKAKLKGPQTKPIPEPYKTKIYELRQNKASIQEIIDKLLQEDGIKISRYRIEKTLNTIYAEKREEEPKAKAGRKKKIIDVDEKKKRIKHYDEEICSLKEQGYGVEGIKDILEKEYGFKTGVATIFNRIKKIYQAKGEEIPKASKSQRIKKQVLELREQGLEYNEIVEKMNSDYGIKVNRYTILKICKEAFGKATRKQIKEMGRLKKLEEELNNLQQTKNESQQLLEQYEKLQKMREEEQNVRE